MAILIFKMYYYRYQEPELTGVVILEKKKCNKPNCHCAKTKFRHKAYYLYYREYEWGEWKLRKKYLKKSEVVARKKQIWIRKEDAKEYIRQKPAIKAFLKWYDASRMQYSNKNWK